MNELKIILSALCIFFGLIMFAIMPMIEFETGLEQLIQVGKSVILMLSAIAVNTLPDGGK